LLRGFLVRCLDRLFGIVEGEIQVHGLSVLVIEFRRQAVKEFAEDIISILRRS
jgi:hypothetical protein